MAWDSSRPTDTEKIRNLGEASRPNFQAIEEGDETSGTPIFQKALLLGDRNVIASATDPTVVGATIYLYSKQDGSGTQEAYIKDAASNEIQITRGGAIGADDVTLNFEDFTNDSGTTTYDERNFVAYWATVNAAGTIQDQSGGLTCVVIADSSYTIGFAVAQSGTNYGVNITAEHTPGNPQIGIYSTKTVNDFVLRIVNQSGTLISGGAPFTVSIFGGRPT